MYQFLSPLELFIVLRHLAGVMSSFLGRLREFGTRSRVVYALMLASFLAALGSAFLLSGQVAVVSFVAFVNFTAGLWIAQTIHTLGHAFAGEPAVEPVVEKRPPAERPGLFEEIAWERFLRVAVVTAFAAAVFVFTATEILSPTLSTIAVGAIGAIALLAAMIGFLIAAAATLDHEQTVAQVAAANRQQVDDDAAAAGEDR